MLCKEYTSIYNRQDNDYSQYVRTDYGSPYSNCEGKCQLIESNNIHQTCSTSTSLSMHGNLLFYYISAQQYYLQDHFADRYPFYLFVISSK